MQILPFWSGALGSTPISGAVRAARNPVAAVLALVTLAAPSVLLCAPLLAQTASTSTGSAHVGGCGATAGPDLIVAELTGTANYAAANGLDAFSFGTTSCNFGTASVQFQGSTAAHPLEGMALYRHKSVDGAGRFEQIGQSWLAHAFIATNSSGICTCQNSGSGSLLGPGCSNTHGAALNGSQANLRPRWQVNAHTGVFTWPGANPSFSGTTARRLEVLLSDLEPSSAVVHYYAECATVAADDAAANNNDNNASYRAATVTGSTDFTFGLTSTTQREMQAIRAWPLVEPGVTLTDVRVPGEGLFVVGSHATDLGGGTYHYEYAVLNMNSDRNGGSFTVPIAPGTTITNVGFHGVLYRNGDGPGNVNFSGADWAAAVGTSSVSWACETQAQNQSANALRWGTTYNFRFDATAAPVSGNISLGLWKPGSPAFVSAAAEVPSGPIGCGMLAQAPQTATTGAAAQGGVLADFDGDGLRDVALANSGDGTVSVLRSNGSGGLSTFATISTGVSGTLSAIAVEDFDCDGRQDIAVSVIDPAACSPASFVRVFLGDGLGGFQGQTPAVVGPRPVDVVACDLDNDGNIDIVSANSGANAGCPDESLTLLFGDGGGGFGPAVSVALGTSPQALATADIDADGDADLLAVDTSSHALLLLGDGAGTLVPQAPVSLGAAATDITLADFVWTSSPDGVLDALVTLPGIGAIGFLRLDGMGQLEFIGTQTVGGQPSVLSSYADVDNNGLLDVVVADASTSDVRLLIDQGGHTYVSCGALAVATPRWVDCADIDDDGAAEVLVAAGLNQIHVYAGQFAQPGTYGGKLFPAGLSSFADSVETYAPGAGGGPAPLVPFGDPLAALDRPDSAGATGPRATSIGRGGRLVLSFTDNRLSNSGSSAKDLAVFEVGSIPEKTHIDVRPSGVNTIDQLATIGVTPDGTGYVSLGDTGGLVDSFDLDAVFPGFGADRLHFDSVRLTDAALSGPQAGPSVGADIDAVGALRSTSAAADLNVTTLVVPTEGFAEQPYSVTWTVRNSGDMAASGGWIDRVFRSTDGTMLTATVLSTSNGPVALAPGASYTRTVQLNYPSTPGTFWIIVATDDGHVVGEGLDEGNNARTSAASIQVLPLPRPDLQAEVLSIPGVDVASGSQITIGYRITNLGTASTSSPIWNDHFYLTTSNAPGTNPTSGIYLGTQTNQSFLSAGGLYDGTFVARLPHDFSGTRYIAVVADAQNQVNELFENNNNGFSSGSFGVTLEPQPDLVVEDVHFASAPPVTAFSGTYLQVLWTDRNQGIGITDSGSWIDRLYLSLDANPSISVGDVVLSDSGYNSGFLNPGQATARSAQVLIPPATSGTRYVKVLTDLSNGISEFGAGLESNNIAVAVNPVDVILSITPDLRAASVGPTSPAPYLAGHPISLQWSVVDDGTANWNFNFSWTDVVYLSSNPTYEEGTDTAVWSASQSAVFSGGLWLGSTYTKSAGITLPQGTAAGTWYLLARIDTGGNVFEYDATYDAEGNNFVASAPFQVVIEATDLVVTPVTPPSSGAAGQSVPLAFQVQNVGPAITPTSSWTDRVWLSSNATLGGDQIVASIARGSPLAPGAGYPASTTGTIPLVVPGAYFLLYETDTANQVWELDGESNNVVAVPFAVSAESADLVVDSFVAPTTAQGGQLLPLTWQVSNSGTLGTSASTWTDRVYLSVDAIVDAGDIHLGERTRSGLLSPGQSYGQATSFQLPLTLSGLWYAIVVSDVHGQVFESSDSNNTRLSRMLIDVAQAPPANLTVSSVIAATTATAGQPISVSWTVRNIGTGSTSVATWPDNLYLSLDQFVDPATDRFLGSFQHAGFLGAGEERVLTQDFLIPQGVGGSYFVVVRTNTLNSVFEAGASTDNDGSTTVLSQISLPPVSDLQVTDVQVPSTAVMGNPLTVQWTTMNATGSTIVGQWRDSLYLSADDDLDASDKLLSQVVNTAGALPVGATHTQNATATVPGLLPGAYHVLVRSDALNQIPELSEGNNVTASVATVDVAAIPLSPGDQSAQAMLDGESRYYRLDAPAGLTIRVHFAHQSGGAWTELYVKRGDVPGPGHFDFAFSDPGANQQEVVIPVTDGSPHFIQSRVAFGANAGAPSGTLTTEILPFTVLQATPPTVGAGRVTVRLAGSQLNALASASLRRSGTSEVYPAIGTAIVDAAAAFVAFDLTGATLGEYDVLAIAGGGGSNELLGAVVVELPRPLESQLTLSTSPSIKKGSSGQLDARLRNSGNLDIPRTALVLGASATSEFQVHSQDLDVADLESDGVLDTLLLLVEDLGPGQEVGVPFDLSIGSAYVPPTLPFGIAGKPLSAVAFDALLADAAELLRGAVLADPASGAGLLARASTASGWLSHVVSGLPPDVSVVHVPGTPPQTGRSFLGSLAQAVGAGMPPNDQVGEQALSRAAGDLHCAPFVADAFDCSSIAPAECGTALSEVSVTTADGANVPLGVACCSTPTSDDPNEKEGPVGYGAQGQVSGQRSVAYRIYFENVPTALAPASLVRITDTLQPVFRASSVRMQALKFGDTLLTLPPNTISYTTTLDRASTLGVLVQITAGVNAATNQVVAIFQSLDPQTGEPVTDGVRGFLPPNDSSGRGSGYMDFLVGTNGGVVVTGTTARNSASIRFDLNLDLPTNETANSFDVNNPTSGVVVNPSLASTFDYQLTWGGTDEVGGSGVASYSVFASKDGGPYVPILSDSRSTSMVFSADAGSTYRIYSLARDNTGNLETPPAVPDATITVPPDCNENHVADAADIAQGASQDCDANAIPDECQADGDGDGAIDACDGCPADPAKIAPGLCGCGVADTDTDGDATADCNDGCPIDPLKIAPGACGCGAADVDTDGDAVADCVDGCPMDPAKTLPGACGCGIADTDADGDATADCIDGCPADPLKTAPGACGCGVADVDTDGDAVADCADGCPTDPAKIAPGACGCGVADTDTDGDATADCVDGCPADPLKVAPGTCGCGVIDVDTDLDGAADCIDNCVAVSNATQEDADGDGRGDVCDNCTTLPNPGQEDCDANAVGDVCDLAAGAPDCNGNGSLDACDIAGSTSQDLNANGIPDECETNGGTAFCFGDSGCPCGNDAAPGSHEGCTNSTGTGASLTGSGLTSVTADGLRLTATQLPLSPNPVLFFQGSANAGGTPFYDGKRCAGGSVIRLGLKVRLSGTASYPEAGDPSVSARGLVPAIGGARYYQVWYRNVLGPCGSRSNLTNGLSTVWVP